MLPRKKARLAFRSALILLVACGIAASVTILRFSRTAHWTTHSYDVRIALSDLQSTLSNAARTRTMYMNSGDESLLAPYSGLKTHVHEDLIRVRDLVLHPDAQTRQQLAGAIKLVASYQKNPSKAAVPGSRTGSTRTAGTPSATSRSGTAASTPSTPPPQPGKK